jgi:hypothetical protein
MYRTTKRLVQWRSWRTLTQFPCSLSICYICRGDSGNKYPSRFRVLDQASSYLLQINSDDRTETAVAVADEDYYSGGGFSNYWPTPDYQQSTLANYFKKTPPPYNLTSYGNPYYNQSGHGYPDVSAVGLNILLYVDGQSAFVGGTSASAPIFASIINLINEKRLAAGKSTVGFINPTLYKNPHAFTDVSYLAAVVYAFTNKTDYHWKQSWLQHQWLQRCKGLGSGYWSRHSKVL